MISSEIVVLLSTISTGLLALLGLCIRYAFLSKCVNFKMCCCSWERNVEAEIKNTNNTNLQSQNSIGNINNV